VLITDPTLNTNAVRNALRSIYADLYVEYVAKNPLATISTGPTLMKTKKKPPLDPTAASQAMITNVAFKSGLNKLIRELSQSSSS
jgi:hypothetical protein